MRSSGSVDHAMYCDATTEAIESYFFSSTEGFISILEPSVFDIWTIQNKNLVSVCILTIFVSCTNIIIHMFIKPIHKNKKENNNNERNDILHFKLFV